MIIYVRYNVGKYASQNERHNFIIYAKMYVILGDRVGEFTSGRTSESMPDKMSESMSKFVTRRMPELMADRFAEFMTDKMSEFMSGKMFASNVRIWYGGDFVM